MRRLTSLVLCVAAASAAARPASARPSEASPTPASAAPTDPELPTAVRLRLVLPGDDVDFDDNLGIAVADLLEARDVAVDPDADHTLAITIDLDPMERGSYRVSGAAWAGRRDVPDGDAWTTASCLRCGSAQLVAEVAARVEFAMNHIDPEPPRPPVTQPPPNPEPQATPAPLPPTRLGPKGIAGVVLIGTGFAAVATGAGLWARKTLPHPSRPDWELRTRPPGIGLVVGGGAAAVAGAVLVALELRSDRVSRTTAVPVVSRNLAGIAISGRF